jgi:hypothetical protein
MECNRRKVDTILIFRDTSAASVEHRRAVAFLAER